MENCDVIASGGQQETLMNCGGDHAPGKEGKMAANKCGVDGGSGCEQNSSGEGDLRAGDNNGASDDDDDTSSNDSYEPPFFCDEDDDAEEEDDEADDDDDEADDDDDEADDDEDDDGNEERSEKKQGGDDDDEDGSGDASAWHKNLEKFPWKTPFTATPGLRTPLPLPPLEDCKPFDFYSLFITTDLIQRIAQATNRNADDGIKKFQESKQKQQKEGKLQDRKELPEESLYSIWRPVSQEEVRLFLAVLIHMGILQNALEIMWPRYPTLQVHLRSRMPHERFQAILAFLSINDDPTQSQENPGNDSQGEPATDSQGKPGNNPQEKPDHDPKGKPSNDPHRKPASYPQGNPGNDPKGKPASEPPGKPDHDLKGKPGNDSQGKPASDLQGKSDQPGKDPLYMIRPLINHIVQVCWQIFYFVASVQLLRDVVVMLLMIITCIHFQPQ
jgi:hypothetical protein